MKIWLDDVREAPAHWVRAYDADDAIRLISNCDVEEISLDHNLAYITKWSGYEVACYIERGACDGWLPKMIVRCHSQSPRCRERIEAVIKRAEKAWKE